jgi:hypothetical protein
VEDKLRRQQQQSQATAKAAEAAEAHTKATAEQLQQLQQQLSQALEAADISSRTAEVVEQLQSEVQAALDAARSAEAAAEAADDTAEEARLEAQRALAAAAEATAAAEQSKQVAAAIEQLQQGVQDAVFAAKSAESAARDGQETAAAIAQLQEDVQQAAASAAAASAAVSHLKMDTVAESAADLLVAAEDDLSIKQAIEELKVQLQAVQEQLAAQSPAALEQLTQKVQELLSSPGAAAANAAGAVTELRFVVNRLGAETELATQKAADAMAGLEQLRENVRKGLADAVTSMHEALAGGSQPDTEQPQAAPRTVEEGQGDAAQLVLLAAVQEELAGLKKSLKGVEVSFGSGTKARHAEMGCAIAAAQKVKVPVLPTGTS